MGYLFSNMHRRVALVLLAGFLAVFPGLPVVQAIPGPNAVSGVTVNGVSYTGAGLEAIKTDGLTLPAVQSRTFTFTAAYTLTGDYPAYRLYLKINDPGQGIRSDGRNIAGAAVTFDPYTFSTAETLYPIELLLVGLDAGGGETVLDSIAFNLSLGVVDSIPPQVSSITPVSGTVSVPVHSAVQVVFSEPLQAGTVTGTNIYLSPTVSTQVTLGGDIQTVTLTPAANLAYSTLYTVSLRAEGIRDLAGNPAVPAASSFTTQGNPAGPPSLMTRQPIPNATDVAVDASVTLALDKTLNLTLFGADGLTLQKGTTVIPVTIIPRNVDGRCLITLTPIAKLEYNTQYTVTVAGNRLRDENGYYLPGSTWKFTTALPPTPIILTREPVADAVGVPFDKSIVIVFSKAMNPSTLTAASIYVKKAGASAKLDTSLFYNPVGNTVTLTPAAELAPSTVYNVFVTNSVKDATGIAVAPVSWKFTTRPTYVRLLDRSPASGDGHVPLDLPVTFRFSEAVQPATVSGSSIYLQRFGSSVRIEAAIAYDSLARTLTLTPREPLAEGTDYIVSLASGVVDAKGIGVPTDSWLFRTRDSNYPHITSRYPAPGTMDIPVDAEFRLVCSSSLRAETVRDTTVYLRRVGTTQNIPAVVAYNGQTNTITLRPAQNLPGNSEYIFTVTGAVLGSGGEHLYPVNWQFKTGADKTALVSSDPPAGAAGIRVDKALTLKFSRPLRTASITGASITLLADGSLTPAPAALTWSSDAKTVTIKPVGKLTFATRYTVYVTNSVLDSDGNSISAATVGFTTVPEGERFGTAQAPLVNLDGRYLDFAAPPYVVSGRVMLPFRALFEVLGAAVDYDGSDPQRQRVTGSLGENTVTLYIGDPIAYRNNVPQELDAAPQISAGRTMIPLRFTGEALGVSVSYNETNHTVFIDSR